MTALSEALPPTPAVLPVARRILVVDDHPVVFEGVRSLLDPHPDLTLVGEAGDPGSALRMASDLQPDAVILDLRIDGRFVPELATRIKAAAPGTLVLIHTASEQTEPVHAALRAGADGAVFKDGRNLVVTLRRLLGGEPAELDPRLRTDRTTRRGLGDGTLVDPLSPREYDILSALALGHATREIADELHLAESTVRTYTKSLLAKLGVRSRVEALAVARRAGLI